MSMFAPQQAPQQGMSANDVFASVRTGGGMGMFGSTAPPSSFVPQQQPPSAFAPQTPSAFNPQTSSFAQPPSAFAVRSLIA
jgi:hypothetical protein